MLVAVLLLVAQPVDPWPQYYTHPTGQPGDHLLPMEDVFARDGLETYAQVVVSALELPPARHTSDVHAWGVVYPSFQSEAAYVLRWTRTNGWTVAAARAVPSVWSAYHDRIMTSTVEEDGIIRVSPNDGPPPDGVVAKVKGQIRVERCEASMDAALAVRFIDQSNARLARTRAGLVAEAKPGTITMTMDGAHYVFGGVTIGRTSDGYQGPDVAALRAAADTLFNYCFEQGPGALERLTDAVRVLEASEPN